MEKIVIIWWGPAGHTSAIYAAQARLNPLMFEWFMAGGVAAWWQLTTTTIIENFPGFPGWVGGPELMMRMRQQSEKLWVRIQTKTVDKVDLSSRPFKVFVWSDIIETQTIVISTWASAKRMWLPGEKEYRNRWISACAVCDGGLPIFRDKHLVVIGWWDTAMEEALHLTHFASKVSVLVRKDHLRASQSMQEKAQKHEKIEILFNTEAQEVVWDGKLMNWIKIINNQTNQESTLEASGLFYAIWHKPNTDFLWWQITTDESWYIITKPNSTKTNIEWVFAAWDVQDNTFRQAITSAWTGCMSTLEAIRFMEDNPL